MNKLVQKIHSFINFGRIENNTILSSEEITVHLPKVSKPIKNYIGHEQDLDAVFEKNKKIIVINGIGGIGKTEFAKKYALRFYCDKAYFLQFSVSMKHTITTSRGAYAISFGNKYISDSDGQYSVIIEKMKTMLSPEDLLIIDNVSGIIDNDIFQDVFTLPCKFLLTSRTLLSNINNEDIGSFTLNALDLIECIQLFESYYFNNTNTHFGKEHREILVEIVKRAYQNTITIELLAKTCRKAGLPLQQMQELLIKNGFLLAEEGIAVNRNNESESRSIAEHLTKLFDIYDICLVISDAERILKQVCVIGNSDISKNVLCHLVSTDINSINQLIEFGWLQESSDGESISIHDIIAESLQIRLKPKYDDISHMIDIILQDISDDYINARLYQTLIHKIIDIFDENTEQLFELALQGGYIYLDQQKVQEALHCACKAKCIGESLFTEKALSLAEVYHLLALLYSQTGDYSQAEELFKKAISIRELHPENDQIELAQSHNALASVYLELDDIDNAIKHLNIVLSILMKNTDSSDYWIGATLLTLAFAYKKEGNQTKAIEYCKKGMCLTEKYIDDVDEMVINRIYIASILDSIDNAAALKSCYEAKEIVDSEGYNNNQNKASTYNWLLLLCLSDGNVTEAIKHSEIVEEILEKDIEFPILLKGHMYYNIGIANLLDQSNYKAISALNKALTIYKSIYGDKDDKVSKVYVCIGKAYSQSKDDKKARYYYRKGSKAAGINNEQYVPAVTLPGGQLIP